MLMCSLYFFIWEIFITSVSSQFGGLVCFFAKKVLLFSTITLNVHEARIQICHLGFLMIKCLNVIEASQVYSNYKKYSIIKFLIACTLLGSISFLSKVWGSCVSDIDIVKDFGVISPNLHHHGDQILADCGFTLEDDFAAGCCMWSGAYYT